MYHFWEFHWHAIDTLLNNNNNKIYTYILFLCNRLALTCFNDKFNYLFYLFSSAWHRSVYPPLRPCESITVKFLKPFKRVLVSVNLSVEPRVGRSGATSACPGPCCWLFGCAVQWWWPAPPSAPAPDSCPRLSSLFLKRREKLFIKMVVEAKCTWPPPSGWMQYGQQRCFFFNTIIQMRSRNSQAKQKKCGKIF